jgi:rare lipoprotein A
MKRSAGWIGVALGASLMMAGCAETTLAVDTAKAISSQPDGPRTYKIGSPYEVRGQWYVPHENYEYDEVGMASWYGPKFHGRTTANGERFDQNALTAAHRTLPMPSVVRVTNLKNGRAVDLRINDRGPFSDNRIIDVSKKAAEVLGFRRDGTARVRVQVLADESLALRNGDGDRGGATRIASVSPTPALVVPAGPSDPAAAHYASAGPGGGWFIQAGAFSDRDNANQVVQDLATLAPAHLTPVSRYGQSLYRVRIGPLPDNRVAARLLKAVRGSGYPEARMISN